MNVTIYHNPRCSKSRQTLQLLRERGIDATIVHYLDHMPDPATLMQLAKNLNVKLAALVRPDPAGNGDVPDASADEEALAEWLSRHPKALQRPLVIDEDRQRGVIGRPPENVLELLGPAGRD